MRKILAAIRRMLAAMARRAGSGLIAAWDFCEDFVEDDVMPAVGRGIRAAPGLAWEGAKRAPGLALAGVAAVGGAAVGAATGVGRRVFSVFGGGGGGGVPVPPPANQAKPADPNQAAARRDDPLDGWRATRELARKMALGLTIPEPLAERVQPKIKAWLSRLTPDQLQSVGAADAVRIRDHLLGTGDVINGVPTVSDILHADELAARRNTKFASKLDGMRARARGSVLDPQEGYNAA